MNLILVIFLIFIIKVILTKVISLIITLISFALKGKQLNYNTKNWNDYLRSLSNQFAIKFFTSIYIISSIISCVICYFIIQLFNVNYIEIIILSIFVITLIFTMIKFKVKGNNYITKKHKK